MTALPINPGDWLIRQSRFGYDVAQAERTSKVLERLNSSQALRNQEQLAAAERHRKRVAKITGKS